MNEDTKIDSKKTAKILNVAIIAVIIIAGIIYALFTEGDNIVFDISEEGINISGPENSGFSIPYSYIISIEENENAQYGNAVDGNEDQKFRYGLWKNEEWGTYKLCASVKNTKCIVVTATDDIYVFNYGNAAETDELYTNIIELLSSVKIDN